MANLHTERCSTEALGKGKREPQRKASVPYQSVYSEKHCSGQVLGRMESNWKSGTSQVGVEGDTSTLGKKTVWQFLSSKHIAAI